MRAIAILVIVAFLVSFGGDAWAVPVTSLPAPGESNAGLVEYVLLIGLIAAVAITGMKLLGSNTNAKLNNAGNKISNTGAFQAAPLLEASATDTAMPPDTEAMTSVSVSDPSGASAAAAVTITNTPVNSFTPMVTTMASVSRPVTAPEWSASAAGQATGTWDVNASTASLTAQLDFSGVNIGFNHAARPGDMVSMGVMVSHAGMPVYDWGFTAAVGSDLVITERVGQFTDADLTLSGRSITGIRSQQVTFNVPMGMTTELALETGFAIVETAVPEPGTLLLLASGLGALSVPAWRRRRRR